MKTSAKCKRGGKKMTAEAIDAPQERLTEKS